MPEKPKTQKDQIDALWSAIIGTNGKGMAKQVRDNREDISEIKEDVAYVKGKLEGHAGASQPSRKTVTLRRLLETLITAAVLGVIVLGAVLLIAGRLTPDDIAQILRAWRGAP